MLNWLREKYHYGRYQIVKQLIEKPGNLLDVGCGRPCESMEDCSFIRYLGYGTGMDVKEYSNEIDFKRGDIQDPPFQKDTFDTIIAMEVLEHVNDINLALKNIHGMLRQEGVFIMSTPNNGLIWRFLWYFWHRTVGGMWKNTHKVAYTKREWIQTLEEYFRIIEIRDYWGIDLIVKMKK